jgi:hypothetical protein
MVTVTGLPWITPLRVVLATGAWFPVNGVLVGSTIVRMTVAVVEDAVPSVTL